MSCDEGGNRSGWVAFWFAVRARSWVAVSAAVATVLAGGWTFLNRGASIDLSCPRGETATTPSLSAVIGIGHGGAGATLVLRPDGAVLGAAFGSSRTLDVRERDALLERLRRPSPAARQFVGQGRVSVHLEVAKTCGGVEHSVKEEVELRRQHPTFGSWLARPLDFSLLWTVLTAEAADRDPHAQHVAATAAELIFAAYPEMFEKAAR